MNEGFEFYLKADGAQNVLKLLLFLIAAVDGERDRPHHGSALRDFRPKAVVIEIARELLARRVINVLHIDEYCDGLQIALACVGKSR